MRTLTTISRRPLCRGIGLVRFLGLAGVLSVGIAWGLPRIDDAANSIKLATTANVVLHQLAAARVLVQRSGGRVAACRSEDGVLCTAGGTWSHGWIVFEDGNRDGLRGAGEAVLEHVAALPGEFRLEGNLATGVFVLCSRERGPGDARQIALQAGTGSHLRKVRVASCA